MFIKRPDGDDRYDFKKPEDDRPEVTKFQSKGYMDGYVNPPEFLRDQAKKQEAERQKIAARSPSIPSAMSCSSSWNTPRLEPWQRDVPGHRPPGKPTTSPPRARPRS